MSYWNQFDGFDPLCGDVPGVPLRKLPEVAHIARRLLSGRTAKQLASAAEIVDWMIEEYFVIALDARVMEILESGGWELGYLPAQFRNEAGVRDLLENWPSDASSEPDWYPTRTNTSDYHALIKCIDDYSLGDEKEVPSWQPFEFFAVLALLKVADCIRSLNPPDLTKALGDAMDRVTAGVAVGTSKVWIGFNAMHSVDQLVEGLEAVSWAEHLRETSALEAVIGKLQSEIGSLKDSTLEQASKLAKQRISLVASKAAVERHAENRAMKKEVWTWCGQHLSSYSSMDKAAESIAGKLVPVAFRTARLWIGEWVKDQRSARRP